MEDAKRIEELLYLVGRLERFITAFKTYSDSVKNKEFGDIAKLDRFNKNFLKEGESLEGFIEQLQAAAAANEHSVDELVGLVHRLAIFLVDLDSYNRWVTHTPLTKDMDQNMPHPDAMRYYDAIWSALDRTGGEWQNHLEDRIWAALPKHFERPERIAMYLPGGRRNPEYFDF
ncbi:hypothetical protein CIG75_19165 [Tumebacillus algifaecis]|uniref:Uncharacterized protein n=1 Tax=Tumebacillus algifaecis TaxID=1214604 RepID=A0A223D652_9BACL|nr:hypothetical protein [Tumebacillus algifaecis]ASS76854.1 hypothetical protein CIG75_19165 [Tumebacillus algifaecis]